MTTVVSLKMITGEEVVAELKSTNTSVGAVLDPMGKSDVISYTLRRPHILQFQPIGPGQLGLAFVPWTLSNPDIETINVPASAVLVKFDPSSKVEKQYLEQTSGISLDRIVK